MVVIHDCCALNLRSTLSIGPNRFVDPDLCPQEAVECFGKYTVTQTDVDSGERRNTAHVTPTSPHGVPSVPSDEVILAVLGKVEMTIGEACSCSVCLNVIIA